LKFLPGIIKDPGDSDAERSLLASETALALSRQAISSDLANIYRALGGGWEEKN
jgi:outer membrane protein TolC